MMAMTTRSSIKVKAHTAFPLPADLPAFRACGAPALRTVIRPQGMRSRHSHRPDWKPLEAMNLEFTGLWATFL